MQEDSVSYPEGHTTAGGWVCSLCGAWVDNFEKHYCHLGEPIGRGTGIMVTKVKEKEDEVVELLREILAELRKLNGSTD